MRFALFRPWTERSWVSAAAGPSAVYLVGGKGPDGTLLNDVLRVDTDRMRIRRVARLPAPLMGCASATVGDTLYVLGGYTGSTTTDAILRVDTRGRLETAARLPSPRAFGATVAVGDRIYYLGGWDGSRVFDDIVEFDTASGQVRTVGRLPAPRQYAAAAFLQGRILLLGGEDDTGREVSEMVEIDPADMRVVRTTRVPGVPPQPRIAVVNGRVLSYDGFAADPLSVVSLLDPTTLQSAPLLGDPLPLKDRNLAIAPGVDAAYLVGGVDPVNTGQVGFLRIKVPPEGVTPVGSPVVAEAIRLGSFLLLF